MSPAEPRSWSRQVSRVLAPNPGPMTLDGTNTLIVREPGYAGVVVVDPGPSDPDHLQRISAFGRIELILLTHHHLDHTEAAAELHRTTGAPVRAFDPALCLGAPPLRDRETIEAGGVHIEIEATPGHTADSVCLHLPDDTMPGEISATGTMLTGDTILGRGSTVIAAPSGNLGDYLDSLARLHSFGAVAVLPAHGEPIGSLEDVCDLLLGHRRERIAQIKVLLAERGMDPADPAALGAVVEAVYGEVEEQVRFAAEMSTRAQLEYLSGSART